MKDFTPSQKFVNSIYNFVEAFNEKYFKWKEFRNMEYIWWYMPMNFEFDDYYIFSIDEIYSAMYYDIDRETLIERYNKNMTNWKKSLVQFLREKNSK